MTSKSQHPGSRESALRPAPEADDAPDALNPLATAEHPDANVDTTAEDALDGLDPPAGFRLDGRVAVVTGASSGLGARFARVLCAAGAAVVLTARRSERLRELEAELGRDRAAAVTADVTAADTPQRLLDAADEHFGPADILVNNAGIAQIAPAVHLDEDAFRHEIDVNLVAPYAMARAFASRVIARAGKGTVVNLGSIFGSAGGSRIRLPGYAAAKGGLHNLTRALAAEWARRGVRVNALAPGWFLSELTADVWNEKSFAAYVAESPMGRGGRAHELDGALLFLCSDASSFVTGHVLCVDGGWGIV